MEQGGFIKLYRSMLQWEWYDDVNVKVLFLHLLLKANYEEKKWRGNKIEKGQLLTTITTLSEETRLTPQQIRTCIKKLESTKEITVKSTNKKTLISIEKWRFYQCCNEENNKQITNKQQTNNKQITNEQQTNNKQITTKQEGNDEKTQENQGLEGIEEEKERKEAKERNKEYKEYKEYKEREEREEKKNIYQLIADMYNATCVSLPRCTKLSETREKALRARLRRYTVEDFKRVFEIAENTDFLKGANARNWSANFDWLIKDGNMAKVLDGNYTCKAKTYQQETAKGDNIFFEIGKEEGLF